MTRIALERKESKESAKKEEEFRGTFALDSSRPHILFVPSPPPVDSSRCCSNNGRLPQQPAAARNQFMALTR